MRSHKRFLATGAAVALLAGVLTFGATGSAQACGTTRSQVFAGLRSGGMETVTLRTFHLEIKAPKTVSIGQTAAIKVNVTRPAKEDPLGNGVPMERPIVLPAPDVFVGVGLHIGRVFLPGAAMTDENGDAVIKIKIEPYAPAGIVDLSAYAWKVAQQLPCATIQEDGYRTIPGSFKTTR